MKKIVSALVILAMIGALGCGLWLINLGGGSDGVDNKQMAQAALKDGTGELTGWKLIEDYATLNDQTTRTLMGTPGYKFKLTSNIQFPANANWTPIPLLAVGNILCGQPTPAQFDWDSHVIDGLRCTSGNNKGLFDNMMGTVRNIHFTNINITGTNSGAVAARVQGDTSGNNQNYNHYANHKYPEKFLPLAKNMALIENVEIKSGSLGGNNTGGLVGIVTGGARLTVIYSHNFARIIPSKLGAGLIAEVNGGSRVHFTYSMNGAEVVLQGNGNDGCAGGIIAHIQGGSTVTMDTVYNREWVRTTTGNGSTAGGIIGKVTGTNNITLAWCGSTAQIGNNNGHMRNVWGLGPNSINYDGICFFDIGGLVYTDIATNGYGGWPTEDAQPYGEALELEIRRIALHEITILPHSPSDDGYLLVPVAANATNKVWSGEYYSFTVTLEASYSSSDFAIAIMNTANTSIKYYLTRSQAKSVNGLVFSFTTTHPVMANLTIGILSGIEGGMKRNAYTVTTTNTTALNKPSNPDPSTPFWFVGSTNLPQPEGNIEHGDPYTFQIQVGPQYNQAGRLPTVTVKNLATNATTTLTGVRAGDVFTYSIPSVTADMSITITAPQKNTHTVIIPGNGAGYTVTGSGTFTVDEGSSRNFSVNFLSSHENYTVLANGQALSKNGGGALTTGNNDFTLPNIDRNITVSISATLKTYTVSTNTPDKNNGNPTAGFAFLTVFNGVSINHGSNFTFSVQIDTGYTDVNPSVLINGAAPNTVVPNGNVWTYTVTNVQQNLIVSVSATINRYTISFARAAGTEFAGIPNLPAAITNIPHGQQGVQTFTVTLADSHSNTSRQNLLSVPSSFAQLQSDTGTVLTYRIVGTVIANQTITLSATRNMYNVNVQLSGAGVTNLTTSPNTTTVAYGSAYSFSFDLAASHNRNPFQLTSSGGNYEIRQNGSIWQIVNIDLAMPASEIRHNISVTISATIKTYTVRFIDGVPDCGFTYGDVGQNSSGIISRQHGQGFNIIVVLDAGRSESNFAVDVVNLTTTATTKLTRAQFVQSGLTFTYAWTEVTANLTVEAYGTTPNGTKTPDEKMEWNKYNVKLQRTGTGFTAASTASADSVDGSYDVHVIMHNDPNLFTFVITFNSGYGMIPNPPMVTVMGGGGIYRAVDISTQTDLSNGRARYEVRSGLTDSIGTNLIRHDIQINIVAYISLHDVTLNSANRNNYTTPTSFPAKVNHGQSFTFVVVANPGYADEPVITFGVWVDNTLTTPAQPIQYTLENHIGNTFTYKIAKVEENIEITVEPQITKYDVAVPLFGPKAIVPGTTNSIVRDPNTPNLLLDSDGVPLNGGTGDYQFIANGLKKVAHGEMNYELTVTVHEHYDINTLQLITVNGGQALGSPSINGREVTYTIGNVTGPLSFALTVGIKVYGVQFWINGIQTTKADGITATGSSTIKLGDRYAFEVELADSHDYSPTSPVEITSQNASLPMLPENKQHMFLECEQFGISPGVYYTGGILVIEIRTLIKQFTLNLNYAVPSTGIASGSTATNLTTGGALAANTIHSSIDWGTKVRFNIVPAAGYAITHIVIDGLPIFLDIDVGVTAIYTIELYKNTVVSFRTELGRPASYNITFREDGTAVTSSKFDITGDAKVVTGNDYNFKIALNSFHSKSNFVIRIYTEVGGVPAGNALYIWTKVNAIDFTLDTPMTAFQFRIPNVQTNLIIDILDVVPNTHTANIFEMSGGFTISNKSSQNITTVDSPGVFTFTVTLDQGYRLTPPAITVNNGGRLELLSQSGRVYNYRVYNIMANVAIDVRATPDTYRITLAPGNAETLGWTTTPITSATVGWNGRFEFRLTVENSHNAVDPEIDIPGTVRHSEGSNSYTFIIPSIQDHLNITSDLIIVKRNVYTVSFENPSNRFTYKCTDNATGLPGNLGTPYSLQREHGDPLVFTITLAEGWSKSISTIKVFDSFTDRDIEPSISGNDLTFALTVTKAMDICIRYGTLSPNKYDVYFPAVASRTGYQISGDGKATFGSNYTFVLDLLSTHVFIGNGVNVRINGETVNYTRSGLDNSNYTISGADILGDIEVTVSVDVKRYYINIVNTINPSGSHFTAAAPISIVAGENLSFSITMQLSQPYYLRAPEVRIKGILVPLISSSGTTHSYSVPWETVAGSLDAGITPYRLTINVTPLINQYRIDMPIGVGYIASHGGNTTATHPEHWIDCEQTGGFTFTISVADSHNKSTPRVMVAGQEIPYITGLAPSNPVYTFTIPVAMLTSNRTIAVFGIDWNTYIMTFVTGEGSSAAGKDGENFVTHNAANNHSFEFTVTKLDSHDWLTPKFTVTGGLVPVLKDGSTDTYIINGISSDTTITVNTSAKIYDVTLDTRSGTGFVFEGDLTLPTIREHGKELAFTINLEEKSHHLIPPKLYVGGIETPLARLGNSNRYTFSTTVTSNTTILIETFINEYTIVFPSGTGYKVAGVNGATDYDTVTYGNNYLFGVELWNSHHIKNPKVWINGELLVNPNREADGHTFIFSSLTADKIRSLADANGFIRIVVEAEENSYTITLTQPTGSAGWSIGSDATVQVLHTVAKFTFWVQLGAQEQGLGIAPAISLTNADGGTVSQTAVQNDESEHLEQQANGLYSFTILNITNDITVNVRLATIYRADFLANFRGSDPANDQFITGTAGQSRPNALKTSIYFRPGYEIIRWVARNSQGTIIAELEANWTHYTMPAYNITFRAEWGHKAYTLNSTGSPLVINHAATIRIGDSNIASIPSLQAGDMISWEAFVPESGMVFERFASSTERTIDLADFVAVDFLARYVDTENDTVTIRAVHVPGPTYTITAQIIDGAFGSVELEQETDHSTSMLNMPINTVSVVTGEIVHFSFLPENNYFKAEISWFESDAWTLWAPASTITLSPTGDLDWAPVFRIRFVSKDFKIKFTFTGDEVESLPQDVVVQGINQEYPLQLNNTTGKYLLNLAVTNLIDIRARGFDLGSYQVISGQADWVYAGNNLTLEIDAAFLDKYLDGDTIEMIVQFLPLREVEVKFLGTPPSGTKFEIYTITYDQNTDEDIWTKVTDMAVTSFINSYAVQTRVAIAVKTDGNFVPTVDHQLMSAAELRDGTYYLYFTVPHSYTVWDPTIWDPNYCVDPGTWNDVTGEWEGGTWGRWGSFVSKTDMLFQIEFVATTYNIVIERLIGTDVHSTLPRPETATINSPFPGLHFANTNQRASIEVTGTTYYFAGWYFKHVNGNLSAAVPGVHVDWSDNILSTFVVDKAFLETYVGTLGSTDTITLVALYSKEVVVNISISVSGGSSTAGVEVYINDNEPITIFTSQSIEVAIGDKVKVKPKYNPYKFDSSITEQFEYTVMGTKTISITYAEKIHDFTFKASNKSNGKLTVQINGQNVNSPNQFAYGDTVTFSFKTSSFRDLKSLHITNGTKRIAVKSGQSITVNDEWLANWVMSDGTLNLDFTLDAKTPIKLIIIIICLIIIILLLVLIIWVLKRKKKDTTVTKKQLKQSTADQPVANSIQAQ